MISTVGGGLSDLHNRFPKHCGAGETVEGQDGTEVVVRSVQKQEQTLLKDLMRNRQMKKKIQSLQKDYTRPTDPTIGGRGVGNWEGDQPNFGCWGKVLGPQGGRGTSSAFLREERGGDKRRN